ncbi:hypothetical protein R6Q57_021414 [Mikania cordata]
MALCLLAANWKTYGLDVASRVNSDFVDGLLEILVDHGLRVESKNEVEVVQHQVLKMGIRCEIVHCEWIDGRPKLGHMKEVARDMRYEKLPHVCSQHQIGALLIAHHADDQFGQKIFQFISQRQRPVHDSAHKLQLDYFLSYPCKVDVGSLAGLIS